MKGLIKKVIYQSQDGEFAVARLKLEEGIVSVVGQLYGIRPEDEKAVWGTIGGHPKYVTQIKVTRWEKSIPTGKEQVIEYLASGQIKGVGKTRAKDIVNAQCDFDCTKRPLPVN